MAGEIAAFPSREVRDAFGNGIVEGSNGMSLRDYFAGQVLGGHLPHEDWGDPEYCAQWAYRLADAMMAERKKPAA